MSRYYKTSMHLAFDDMSKEIDNTNPFNVCPTHVLKRSTYFDSVDEFDFTGIWQMSNDNIINKFEKL